MYPDVNNIRGLTGRDVEWFSKQRTLLSCWVGGFYGKSYTVGGVYTPIGQLDTTVTNKSLNIFAFLARRDTWFGMGDFFVLP